MRIPAALTALVLLSTPATAAWAQRDERPQPSVDQRVRKLEGELRAVQRRVFPNGAPAPADTPPEQAPATRQSVTDLIARIDALEAQLRTMTGQMEELQNAGRQMAERLAAAEAARIAPPSQPAEVAATEPAPTSEAGPQAASVTAGSSAQSEAQAAADPVAIPAVVDEPLPSDPGEAAYTSGFRLYQSKRYDQAIETLQAMAKKYPKHAKASWATNLAGRAHLDAGRPATAAELFFANYQGNPRGERAQDSLFYLGEALTRLDKRDQACTVYQELETVYGRSLRAPIKAALPAARQTARCG